MPSPLDPAARTQAAPPRSLLDHPVILPAFVGGLTVLLYAGALRFGFVYDDRMQVLDNPLLRSWSFLPRYFTSHVWAFGDPTLPANYWRPLFLLWLLLNRTLLGFHPVGWHLTAVALHVAVTALVYRLGRRLSLEPVAAALAALIFGVHPVLIETAAWVSGATDSLLALFLLPAFLLLLRWREQGRAAIMALSLGLYALALLVKETAVVLPLLVFAYAWIHRAGPGPRRMRAALTSAAPYLGVTAVYLVARALVLHGLGHEQNQASALTMLLTWPSLLWLYIRLLVVPYGVSPYYDLKLVSGPDLGHVALPFLGVVVVIAAWAAWLGWLGKHDASASATGPRFAALATAWMVLPVLPVLYLRPLPADDFAHARYLYLPCIGYAWLLVSALRCLPAGRLRAFGTPASQVATGLVIAFALAFSNVRQQVYWADNLLLFSRGVAVAPLNPRALTSMGVELGMRGQYEKAVPYFQRALEQEPRLWFANFNLGYAYLRMADNQAAERYLGRATRLQPRGDAQFAYLATAQMRLGKLDEAAASIREAIHQNPRGERYHYLLGLILEQQGERAAAAAAFQAELALNPSDAEAKAHGRRLQKAE